MSEATSPSQPCTGLGPHFALTVTSRSTKETEKGEELGAPRPQEKGAVKPQAGRCDSHPAGQPTRRVLGDQASIPANFLQDTVGDSLLLSPHCRGWGRAVPRSPGREAQESVTGAQPPSSDQTPHCCSPRSGIGRGRRGGPSISGSPAGPVCRVRASPLTLPRPLGCPQLGTAGAASRLDRKTRQPPPAGTSTALELSPESVRKEHWDGRVTSDTLLTQGPQSIRSPRTH